MMIRLAVPSRAARSVDPQEHPTSTNPEDGATVGDRRAASEVPAPLWGGATIDGEPFGRAYVAAAACSDRADYGCFVAFTGGARRLRRTIIAACLP